MAIAIASFVLCFIHVESWRDLKELQRSEPLLQARRHGSISLRKAGIPKIIHHTYKADLSADGASFPTLVWKAAYDSWKQLYPAPEYTHMFWVDADLENCIKENFPSFGKEFANFSGHIEASDAGRYCILHDHGGIYADLDYEALENFYDELPAGKVSFIESPHLENPAAKTQLQNALMASPPKHPLWQKVFSYMSEPGAHDWNAEHGTGPKMISRFAELHPESLNVLPCARFQRLNAEQNCGDPMDLTSSAGVHWGSMSYWAGNEFGGLKEGGWKDAAFWKLHPEYSGESLVTGKTL